MPLPELFPRLKGGEVTTAPKAAVRQPRHSIEAVAVKQRAAGPAVAAQIAGGIGVGQGDGRVFIGRDCSGRAARCREDGVKVVSCVR